MLKKLLFTALVLCLSLFGITSPSFAARADGETPVVDTLAKLEREGWKPLTEGVLQRQKGGNKVETFAYGPEGMKWVLQELEGRYIEMTDAYKAEPTRKLRQSIRKLRGTIEGIREGLEAGEFSSPLDKASTTVNGCDISFGYHADAYPLNPGPGVGAAANSYFYNNCNFQGEVYAEAKGYATNGSLVTERNEFDGPKYGPNISAAASTSVSGRPSCYSSAYSYVYSSVIGFYSASDSNSQCPDPPLTVTISGPSSVSISGYNCRTLTWTANASGGVPPYISYNWVVDGWSAGSGSSYSDTFCGDNINWTQTVNLQVTVTDSVYNTASDSHSTTIYYSRSSTCDPYAANPDIICPVEPY